jgi:PadR family transcriptional regulator, regulatory protein PadR
MGEVRLTTAVVKVLAALLQEPTVERYGLDLMRATGQPSGTLYPILVRLQQAGWVSARWEDTDPVETGRPARRYYRLTPLGITEARRELAALHQELNRVTGGPVQPRLAGPA